MNKVELSLIVSNDQTNQDGSTRAAVRKVSDKLTVINTFLPGRKNDDGTYGPSVSFEVNVVGKTKLDADVKLEPKARIEVTGFVSPREYEANGKKRTTFSIVANEIKKTVFENDANNGSAPAPAPAATNNAPTEAAAPAPAPVEDDDLPFV